MRVVSTPSTSAHRRPLAALFSRGLLIVLVLLVIAVPAQAATYYTSLSGDDANDCATAQSTSPASQKATIAGGVACLFPGDTLYIHGGTYTGTNSLINWQVSTIRGGTNLTTGAVNISAYPGETVTVRPGAGAAGGGPNVTVVDLGGGPSYSYIIISGLHVDCTGMNYGVGVYWGSGSGHNVFQDGEVGYCGGQGVNTSPTSGAGNQLLRNHVHHNGHKQVGNEVQSHNAYFDGSDNIIDGNEFDNSAAFGLVVYLGATGSNRNIIRNNILHDNCIYAGAELGISGSDNLVYNNVIYGNSGCQAINVEYAPASNNRIYNNTVTMNGGIFVGSDQTGTIVQNNIVRNTANTSSAPITDNGASSTVDHNLQTDPGFIDFAGLNFRIGTSSAAKNTGAALGSVPLDHDGVSRPQGEAFDVGAFEYGVDGKQLAAPANLRLRSDTL